MGEQSSIRHSVYAFLALFFLANPALATTALVNGSCGTSNNQSLASPPTANLCKIGTASSVSGDGPWIWSCAGANGGTTAQCNTAIAFDVTGSISGIVSPSIVVPGQSVAIAATAEYTSTVHAKLNNFSITVAVQAPDGSTATQQVFPAINFVTNQAQTESFNWSVPANASAGTYSVAMTVTGPNGNQRGSGAAAFKVVIPVAGVCGTSNGKSLTSAPTANLCDAGTASALSGAGPWTWSCGGTYGAATAQCNSVIPFNVTTSAAPTLAVPGQTLTVGATASYASAAQSQMNGFAISLAVQAPDGSVVGQQTTGKLNFIANQTQAANYSWAVPVNATPGTYKVVAQVIGPLHGDDRGDNASTFTVSAPIDGECGNINGHAINLTPATLTPAFGLCDAGEVSAVTTSAIADVGGSWSWNWTCNGKYGGKASQQCSATPSEASIAVNDLLTNFWVSNPTGGYFTTPGNGMGRAEQAMYALYALWKVTGAGTSPNDGIVHAEMANLIAAELQHSRAQHPNETDFTTCGETSAVNFRVDATSWTVQLLLEAYEVTYDPETLVLAKDSMDCARNRWWDATYDGGFWYDDAKTNKNDYSPVMFLDEETYFEYTGDTTYLAKAIEDEEWFYSHLAITQPLDKVWPEGEGLYFLAYGCPAAPTQPALCANGLNSPGPIGSTYHQGIAKLTGAQTMLVTNMTMAVVDSRLYQLSINPAYAGLFEALQAPAPSVYQARMLTTAAGIRSTETNAPNAVNQPGSWVNVLTDDEDGTVNGTSAFHYVWEVVPQLPENGTYADGTTFQATADAIMKYDRTSGEDYGSLHFGPGYYGGDWQGPINGVWLSQTPMAGAAANTYYPTQLYMSDGAVNIVAANAAVPVVKAASFKPFERATALFPALGF